VGRLFAHTARLQLFAPELHQPIANPADVLLQQHGAAVFSGWDRTLDLEAEEPDPS